jgi:uncharacterized integral membrane protein
MKYNIKNMEFKESTVIKIIIQILLIWIGFYLLLVINQVSFNLKIWTEEARFGLTLINGFVLMGRLLWYLFLDE